MKFVKTYKTCISLLLFLFAIPYSSTVSASPLFGKYDVIIDVGHGGMDPGTFKGNILEKEINLAVGKALYQILQNNKLIVGITRTSDYALSDDSPFTHIKSRHKKDLLQRKLIADSTGTRVFVSLHVNWSNHPRNHGPCVIYQASNQSYTFAQLIQHHLNQVFQTTNLPIKGRSYFLIRKLELPAVIVEMGYLSNERDRRFLTNPKNQKAIADAIAKAIMEYYVLYPV